jgi:ribosome-binding factor A
MGTDRLTRVNELLKREVAEALFLVVNEPGFDLSTVTVTGVIASSDLRSARVLVSIRQDDKMRRRMLNRLRARGAAIQSRITKHVILKYTPHLTFELDDSIAKGDHVLHIIAEIEARDAAATEAPPSPESSEEPTGGE